MRGVGRTDGLAPRHSDDPLPVRLEQALALEVLGSSDRIVVPCSAISLDDQVHSRPPEIGYDSPAVEDEGHVDIGPGEATREDERPDDVLELAARRQPIRKHSPQLADAPAP